MANESCRIGRRPFIIGSLIGIASLSMKGGVKSVFAAVPDHASELNNYQPEFFSAIEWEFIMAACDRLIPSDHEGPGALDAHVPIFIDKQMLTSYGKGNDWYMDGPFDSHASHLFGYQMPFPLRVLYQKGIALTNKYTRFKYNQDFCNLPGKVRDAVLTDLQKNVVDFEQFGEADLNAGYFFTRLLENTKEGYLADPQYGGNKNMAAWVMINFPGARASYPQWIKIHNIKYPLGPVSLSGEQA
ncbi:MULTISPECIES: gluconate 2-dehydrogenase subunit 3 family protein [unclassified Pantoea]|uniref:gluconate 2-dehydrogenase subunit 3 family protein n=1 Tax=unclassified Pantoea TaxID=2630326 RepID=UPI001CD4910A|nr:MULTISPECIES: gluconate 2-dehydrogenase subunit 3 family protein [unclassified Pantoea]MCA1179769.1 gluconate 2-dehydrogenase subunit 3 family protein [Pantoea sp. alder69]MCA1252364.1 gluconate 2-dehydrogenase subunit 3 family protein [Pantoea sp. alder70]MCA1268112.1 gluconate 2-dehydrogenase subunit 3 family protein [Pantoea sp. alder81]